MNEFWRMYREMMIGLLFALVLVGTVAIGVLIVVGIVMAIRIVI